MALNNLESGSFTVGKITCEYTLGYLNIQKEYQLDGKVTNLERGRSLRFNITQKTKYSDLEIKIKFNEEIRFMDGLANLLENEGLIPGAN